MVEFFTSLKSEVSETQRGERMALEVKIKAKQAVLKFVISEYQHAEYGRYTLCTEVYGNYKL